MRFLLNLLLIVFVMLAINLRAVAMDFKEAFAQCDKKPMLMLVYADWVDNSGTYIKEFRELENEFGDTFNYVELNIASKDAKEFNELYFIYPNLPYLLLFRNGGKISRYLDRSCILNPSCSVPRIKSFIL